jgi:hypothetical protein
LDQRGEPEQDTIGALFARLIDDGRALISAELALFRLDFFNRIARARLGIALCVLGVLMGQAAAVMVLISIDHALGRWLGSFGSAIVAALIGGSAAALLIRYGVRRLMLIVDDDPPGDAKSTITMDELFDRARAHSRGARAQLAEAVGEAQDRLSPQALVIELWELLLDHGQAVAHRAVDGLRQRPLRIAAIAIGLSLLLIRPPIGRIIAWLGKGGATRSTGTSLNGKRARRPAPPPAEETTV